MRETSTEKNSRHRRAHVGFEGVGRPRKFPEGETPYVLSFKVRRDLIDRLNKEAARESTPDHWVSRSEIAEKLIEEALAGRDKKRKK